MHKARTVHWASGSASGLQKIECEVLVWLSGARCKWFVYSPADATAIPFSLASLKSILI